MRSLLCLVLGLIAISSSVSALDTSNATDFQNINAIAHAMLRANGTNGITGIVTFEQDAVSSKVRINITLQGSISRRDEGYAMHVHTYGILTNAMKSYGYPTTAGGHFNPNGTQHGCYGINDTKHVGDIGSVWKNPSDTDTTDVMISDLMTLHGVNSIIGRSIVLHSDPDLCYGTFGYMLANGVIGRGWAGGDSGKDGYNPAIDMAGPGSTLNVNTSYGFATVFGPGGPGKPDQEVIYGQLSFSNTFLGDGITPGVRINGSVKIPNINSTETHGWHIHEYGDLTTTAKSGGHFNISHGVHALPPTPGRHNGDLGNVTSDETGTFVIDTTVGTELISIQDVTTGIIGRTISFHQYADIGDTSYGGRIALGVIGLVPLPSFAPAATSAPTTSAPTNATTDAPTDTPTTSAPTNATTDAPTTLAPATDTPTTETPTTETPTTETPTTETPTTPTTAAPTNATATTEVPTTQAPTTETPTTPTTAAPTNATATTEAPTTQAPTTDAPTTPTTAAPTNATATTEVPTTQAPTTQAPTNPTATTEVPTTQAPTNPTATTATPTTAAPTNATATTETPTTAAPTNATATTATPTTLAPTNATATTTAPTTLSPTIVVPTTPAPTKPTPTTPTPTSRPSPGPEVNGTTKPLTTPQYARVIIYYPRYQDNKPVTTDDIKDSTSAWVTRMAMAIGVDRIRLQCEWNPTATTNQGWITFTVAGVKGETPATLAQLMDAISLQAIGPNSVFSASTVGDSDTPSIASKSPDPARIYYYAATSICSDGSYRPNQDDCPNINVPADNNKIPTFPPTTSESWTNTYRIYILIICVVLGGSVLVILLGYCIYRYRAKDSTYNSHSTYVARETFDATEMDTFQPAVVTSSGAVTPTAGTATPAEPASPAATSPTAGANSEAKESEVVVVTVV